MEDMIKIHLREDIYLDAVDLVIFQVRDGKRHIAKPLVFEPYESHLLAEPTARFMREDNVPEQLKQELNIMGLIDNADAKTLKAKDAHLEDMRRLVFSPPESKE